MTTSPDQPDAPPPAGVFDVPVSPDSPTSSFSSLPAGGAAPMSPMLADDDGDGDRARRGGARQWIVGLGIVGAIVVSSAAIALLYYKWYKTDEYQTTIVVWGQPEWEGDTVTVRGSGLPTQLSKDLAPNEGMVIRFHVPPGTYLVRVTDKEGRKVAEQFSDNALSDRMIWWPFRRLPPPATHPAPVAAPTAK